MADLASSRVFGNLKVTGVINGDGSGLTGTATLRATGTTKADVGLGNVPNWSSSTFDSRYWAIGVGTGYAPNKDMNDYQAGEGGYGRSTQANYPSGSTGYNIVTVAGYKETNDLTQWCFPQRGNYQIWYRTKEGSNWRSWREVITTDVSDKFNSSGNYASLRARSTTKADVGLSSVDNYSRAHYDGRYLGKTAKAADSDKLDNLNSTQFVRSDTGKMSAARLPNATATAVGGVKVRLNGTTGYITSNGNNA